VSISNHPLCIAPGHAAVASRSKAARYEDHGLSWKFNNMPLAAELPAH